MRIGLTGGASSVERMIDQAQRAEADGFTSRWYASAVGGDPLVAIAMAGRATASIELGTSVLQTYTAHPVLQANRAVSVVDGMGRPGFTLGLGPSHRPPIEDAYGLSYAHPGRHTEEYVQVLTALLRAETVHFDGEDFQVHVAPRLRAAAAAAGRPAPRIVAGLPVAVHDDVDEARATAAKVFAGYGDLPNYRRLLDIGGAAGPADAAIVGDEAAVTARIEALFAAGATDVWAAPFPVGDDRSASRARTRALLRELANS